MIHSKLIRDIERAFTEDKKPNIISYDTTFNLGDFYVSSLIVKHPLFEEMPAIPVAIMLHHRRTKQVHEAFLREVLDAFPILNSGKILFVSDREVGIVNAAKEVLPNAKRAFCWNHIKEDVKMWLRKNKGTSDDHKGYHQHLKELLKSRSVKEFENKYDDYRQKWSYKFLNYFDKNLYRDIQSSIRGKLEEMFGKAEESGVTTNISESLKELRLDEAVLSFYQLSCFYFAEIYRGYNNCGTWKLRNGAKKKTRIN